MKARLTEIVRFLEKLAPPDRAADWDNVGLIVGDLDKDVHRLLTCLTVTPLVAEEAIARQADLIVTHHPIMFRPVQKLTSDTPSGRSLLRLIQGNVAVYSPHTAFDNCVGGINELLAQRLGLLEVAPLRPYPGRRQVKLVVFVPDNDLAPVMDALFASGAGVIGNYRECSYRLAGRGTFFGNEAAHPTLGQKGRREEVEEWRLEVICPEERVDAAISAMRQAHSYEEPAFDIYPLRANPDRVGEGRRGRLPQPTQLGDLAKRVRTELQSGPVQVVGDPQRLVSRVGVACGSAGEMWRDALQSGCDVFLTGEARFHDCLAAAAENLALILPGHYASEWIGVTGLADILRREFAGIEVVVSEADRDPAIWV